MPFYECACDACEVLFDVRRSVAERDDPVECPQCGEGARRVVTAPGVVFKGDGWASKNNRVKGQMEEKNRRLKAKEQEMVGDGGVPGGRLVPNVGGERVDSWGEAAKLAKSQGKDTSGYKRLAAKEKGSR